MPCKHPTRGTEWNLSEFNGGTLIGKCLRCGERLELQTTEFNPSRTQIRDICQRARQKFEKPGGNCLKISSYIVSSLHDAGVAAEVNKTRVNGNTHYDVIAHINGRKLEIDASKDQFKGYTDEVYINQK